MPTIINIHIRGIDYKLAPDNVSMAEKSAVMAAKIIGEPISYEAMMSPQMRGETQYCMLWWLARRADGENFLTWRQALEEWPEDLTAEEFASMITEADAVPVEGEHPEASGPAS